MTGAGRARVRPPAGCPWGPGTRWVSPGAGRTAAAAALLADATGAPVGDRLAVAFTTDVLDHVRAPVAALLITRAEVRAWREEREPEVAAHWPPWRGKAVPEVLADVERGGPRSDWLAVYRTVHGPPRLSG